MCISSSVLGIFSGSLHPCYRYLVEPYRSFDLWLGLFSSLRLVVTQSVIRAEKCQHLCTEVNISHFIAYNVVKSGSVWAEKCNKERQRFRLLCTKLTCPASSDAAVLLTKTIKTGGVCTPVAHQCLPKPFLRFNEDLPVPERQCCFVS